MPPTAWPDLVSLELFLLVVEYGSVNKAAARRGISQASASRRLDTLERELGLPLLVRTTAGSRPTAQGQVVADWAKMTLAAAGDLMTGVVALRRQRMSSLRVAASMTIAEYLMPGWLSALRRTLPDLEVSLQVGNSDAVAGMVRDGHVDIGFIEAPAVPSDLAHRRVQTDRLVVVIAPMHPWARRRRPVSAATLANTRLIVREPGSGTRTALERVLGAGASAEPLLELSSNAAVKVAVESGIGPAVLSDLAVAADLREGRLRTLATDGLSLTRPLRAIWRRRHRLTTAATTLMTIAKQPPARPFPAPHDQ
jgi:DNA-binding transcriptional LysR family regulator